MSENNGIGDTPLRVYVTGSCEGLAEIVDALRIQDGVEVVGLTEDVPEAQRQQKTLAALAATTRGREAANLTVCRCRRWTQQREEPHAFRRQRPHPHPRRRGVTARARVQPQAEPRHRYILPLSP